MEWASACSEAHRKSGETGERLRSPRHVSHNDPEGSALWVALRQSQQETGSCAGLAGLSWRLLASLHPLVEPNLRQ
jgi:hypothetical protein